MPPLSALRAFEAAGRLGGFAPAAQELGVTPGAVTAHLKTLESAIGAPLFERHHKGVTLTALGRRVLPEFTAAFAALTAAAQRLQDEANPDLVRIATTADLALLWLAPRLPGLRAPGARIEPLVVAGPQAAAGQAQIGVFLERAAAGAGAPLVAVSAPGLVPEGAAPADLPPSRWLQLNESGPEAGRWLADDWTSWAARAGVTGPPAGIAHTQMSLAIEDAAQGAGVLVAPWPLVEAALRAGRLVEPFGLRVAGSLILRVTALRDLPAPSRARDVLRRLERDAAAPPAAPLAAP